MLISIEFWAKIYDFPRICRNLEIEDQWLLKVAKTTNIRKPQYLEIPISHVFRTLCRPSNKFPSVKAVGREFHDIYSLIFLKKEIIDFARFYEFSEEGLIHWFTIIFWYHLSYEYNLNTLLILKIFRKFENTSKSI